jgi:hypothetical protein
MGSAGSLSGEHALEERQTRKDDNPMNRRVGGFQGRSRYVGEEKYLF